MVPQTCRFFVTLRANNTAFLVLHGFNFLFDLDDLLRNVDVGEVDPAAHFVECVDGLVWQVTVGDVATCQLHARFDGLLRVLDAVVLFVLVLDVVQDLNRFLNAGGLHHHLLESPLQCPVLLDVLAVFVQGCRADALNFAPCQGRFEHVGRVQ